MIAKLKAEKEEQSLMIAKLEAEKEEQSLMITKLEAEKEEQSLMIVKLEAEKEEQSLMITEQEKVIEKQKKVFDKIKELKEKEDTTMVHVTVTGKFFHTKSNCGSTKHPTSIMTMTQAKEKNCACSKCFPKQENNLSCLYNMLS